MTAGRLDTTTTLRVRPFADARFSTLLAPAILGVAVIAAWQLAVEAFDIDQYIMP